MLDNVVLSQCYQNVTTKERKNRVDLIKVSDDFGYILFAVVNGIKSALIDDTIEYFVIQAQPIKLRTEVECICEFKP